MTKYPTQQVLLTSVFIDVMFIDILMYMASFYLTMHETIFVNAYQNKKHTFNWLNTLRVTFNYSAIQTGNRPVQTTYCVVFVVFFLRLVYPMLAVSLDCLFLIAPSVFSSLYYILVLSVYKRVLDLLCIWRDYRVTPLRSITSLIQM